jgi:hypothetical protein
MVHHLRGAAAELAYESTVVNALVFLYRDRSREMGEYWDLNDEPKPTVADLKKMTDLGDFRLFPPDLRWTVFVHHEDRIPTLFTRPEWIEPPTSGADETL